MSAVCQVVSSLMSPLKAWHSAPPPFPGRARSTPDTRTEYRLPGPLITPLQIIFLKQTIWKFSEKLKMFLFGSPHPHPPDFPADCETGFEGYATHAPTVELLLRQHSKLYI